MIKTSRQLKDLIRNRAKGDSDKSGLLIRNYGMERFLERVTLSKYKEGQSQILCKLHLGCE